MNDVKFRELVFHNEGGVDVKLTVEAPVGVHAFGPQSVGPNSSVSVPPNQLPVNCGSVQLSVEDATHGTFKQTFGTSAPNPGEPAFLIRLGVRYVIASFRGQFTAGTRGAE